tara:strand:- start:7348 stop:7737 length:390 start_codon:yes stop_codon:yes gene_type:complete
MSKDKELSDLLAEYDPDTLREWVNKQDRMQSKPTPKVGLVVLRKSNDKPVKNGDVVYNREGARYYIDSMSRGGMSCVSMCGRKYMSRGTHHDFGCYVKGTSVHDEGYNGMAKTKQQLRDYWESSLIIKQ